MKSDLDSLMQSRNLDAVMIVGPGMHNPLMVYMTGGAHFNYAVLIKKQGEEPILFHNAMERDEASRTGLRTKSLDEYRLQELTKQAGGDQVKASAIRYQRMLEDVGFTSGRLAVYGQEDAGASYAVYSALQAAVPDITLVGEYGDTLFQSVMATKDQVEVDRIRRVGQVTTRVMGQVADFLTSHRVKDQTLVKSDGTPLTIGEVKNHINLWLAAQGLENPEGTIFAIGRDAGVPHSSGISGDLLRLGQTIVFDIFPCEGGGGYFHDMTRTWCLGYAPDDVMQLYEDVLDVFRQVLSELRFGVPFHEYQDKTCKLFQARGHKTIKDDPLTQEGYVHSLGHGVGLKVHQYPFARAIPGVKNLLEPGVIITIEPGLYYPERGMGVRLEDTIWARPDGKFEILAPYPLDLVLPIR